MELEVERCPSTLEWKKDSWSAHVKLLIGVSLFKVTVTKTLQSPLDVLFQTSFSGTNSVMSSLQNNNSAAFASWHTGT